MKSPKIKVWLYLLILLQPIALLAWYLFFNQKNKYIFIAVSLTLSTIGLIVAIQILLSLHRIGPLQLDQTKIISEEIHKERTRLATELHDTLGLQILQALTLLEARPPFSPHPAHEVLEQSLVDLRLIVDSIEFEDESLATQMGRLRHRLTPVLERKGLQLHWSVSDPELAVGTPSTLPLPRGKIAQQILKAFQSSISNIIEHADASEIWVTLQPYAASESPSNPSSKPEWDWYLSIEDNGCGFNLQQVLTDMSQAGQGLQNILHRMTAIGADLQIQAPPGGGTQILIRWRQRDLREPSAQA